MTNDYKDKVLKYLTGNLEQQQGLDEPIFNREEEIINKNIKSTISDILTERESATNTFIYGKIFNQNIENFLVYGRYNANSKYYGYVAIISKELDVISVITEFKSGTKIYPFISLQQDETGKFYGLTHDYNNINDNYRVCLFNNILNSGLISNNYTVILRQTYLIPNSTSYRFATPRQNRIIKIFDEPVYYITLHNSTSQTIIIKFTINVGMENDWQVYTINYLLDTVIFAIVPDKSSGETRIYFYGLDILTNSTSTFREYSISETTVTELYNYDFNTISSNNLSQIYSNSINSAYISLFDTTNNIIKLYNFTGSNIIEIWHSENAQNTDYLYLENINNITFIKHKQSTSTTSTLYVGMLKDNVLYFYEVYNIPYYEGTILEYIDFYILCNYNMYKMYIPDYSVSNKTYKLVMIYNQYNYNGTECENITSLVPQSAILFSDDEEPQILFARNLYNLNINGNTTVSTIEVPNTALNDTTILNKSLYSQTNTTLAYDITPITKNIYEVLDINFFNTLIMKNSNNIDNEIINNNGATRLNTSMSQTLDYTSTIANKIRINYSDDTSTIQSIGTPTITNGVATYTITIYVPKAINNIEIISNDESTSYQTITGTFDINKYYTLTQDVRVE